MYLSPFISSETAKQSRWADVKTNVALIQAWHRAWIQVCAAAAASVLAVSCGTITPPDQPHGPGTRASTVEAEWRPPTDSDDPATRDRLLREYFSRVIWGPARSKRIQGYVTDSEGNLIRDVEVRIVRMLHGDIWTQYSRRAEESRIHLADGHFDLSFQGWDAMDLTLREAPKQNRYAQVSFSVLSRRSEFRPEVAVGDIVLDKILPDASSTVAVRIVLRTSEEWHQRGKRASEAFVEDARRRGQSR
jgi:hypothetical protein